MNDYEMWRVPPDELAAMAEGPKLRGIPVCFAIWPEPLDDVEIVVYARRKVRVSGK